jgi:hypothetical protein
VRSARSGSRPTSSSRAALQPAASPPWTRQKLSARTARSPTSRPKAPPPFPSSATATRTNTARPSRSSPEPALHTSPVRSSGSMAA